MVDKSEVELFREEQHKLGFELIDITKLVSISLGSSGWCNELNEPEQSIYHVRVKYRKEEITCISPEHTYVIDDDKYVIFNSTHKDEAGKIQDSDFIIFRKVKI